MHSVPLTFGTDLLGRLVVSCEACLRRSKGGCIDCGRMAHGKAKRCPGCIRRSKLEALRRYDQRHRDERRIRERARRASETDEQRQTRLDRKRRWRQANIVKIKLSQRKGRLDGTHGYRDRATYLAAQRGHNARRAEEKRAHALARYYAKHPQRPAPKCAGCELDLPFKGHGRPRKWCDDCRPFASWQERKAAKAAA